MSGPGWQPSAALGRALVVGVSGLVWSVASGRPALLVLVAPLAVHAALALARRPRTQPGLRAELGNASVNEGQDITSRLVLEDDGDVEAVTRRAVRDPYVRARPHEGRVTTWHDPRPEAAEAAERAAHDVVLTPRRWGYTDLGEERVALSSPWAGYRWGPVRLPGVRIRVLPGAPHDRSSGEAPQPRGLVGAHRSVRPGTGSELAGIRAYVPGDRFRRINWRVSARTGDLHVTTTRAEQDAGLLLVVDVLAEYGVSGGVDGTASSLDITVRAAAALAERAVRHGDRVALRLIGGRGRAVPPGGGERHLRWLLGALAEIEPDAWAYDDDARLELRVAAGTTVVVLTPLLVAGVATAVAALVRRGLPVVVVDSLPPADDLREQAVAAGTEAGLADLAWRMRRIERKQVLAALAVIGCPVVAWAGPGTVDEVLRRLSRRAQQPRAGVR